MSKILKNTTISDIFLNSIGMLVPAESQIIIPSQDYLTLASDDSIEEITNYINSGDIVINNGNIDLITSKAINFIKYPDNFIQEKTLYISPSGSNTAGDGSATNPYKDLTGIKDSIESGDISVPSASTPLTISCDSGIYIQSPVDFSSYDNIMIIGKSSRTIFVASNPSEDLITLGHSMTIKSVLIQGVTSTDKYLIKIIGQDEKISSLFDVFFNTGSSNGVTVTNNSGLFRTIIANCFSSQITSAFITCNSNTHIITSAVAGIGNGTSSVGFIQNGSGMLYVYTSNLDNFMTDVIINGNDGIVQLNNLTSLNTNKVLNQLGTSKLEVLGGDFDATKVSLVDSSVIEGYFFNKLIEQNQFRIVSETSIGLPDSGKETSLGEGDSYVSGLLAYTYNGLTYSSVSSEAASPSDSTFTFPSSLVGNSIYISSAFNISSPLKFYGLKINISTACSLGLGDIVFEYWNGSSWVEFNHMMVKSGNPYLSYANSKFEETGLFHINFDARIENDWTTNDPVSIGVNLYWVRFRIVGVTLTTPPVFEQIKINTSRIAFEPTGFQNTYGLGRPKKKFPISLGGLQSNSGRTPNSSDVFLSQSLGISGDENSFPSNQDRSKIFSQFIPFDLDTSCPAELTISYFGDSSLAGVVQWEVIWATSLPLDGVYGSSVLSPITSSTERSNTVTDSIPILSANTDRILSIQLDIPEALTQQTNGNPSSKLWIRLTRDVSGADTYSGNIILTEFSVYYTSYRDGGYSGDIE